MHCSHLITPITSRLALLYIEEAISNCLLWKDKTPHPYFASLINLTAFQCKCKFPRFQGMASQSENTETVVFERHCAEQCCDAALLYQDLGLEELSLCHFQVHEVCEGHWDIEVQMSVMCCENAVICSSASSGLWCYIYHTFNWCCRGWVCTLSGVEVELAIQTSTAYSQRY